MEYIIILCCIAFSILFIYSLVKSYDKKQIESLFNSELKIEKEKIRNKKYDYRPFRKPSVKITSSRLNILKRKDFL